MNYVQPNQATSLRDVVSAVLINPRTRAANPLTEQQAIVAIAAAEEVISAAGLTPEAAAQADFERESWDDAGFPDPGPTEALMVAHVWGEAQAAAQQALSRRWPAQIEKWQWVQLTLDDKKGAA